MRSEPSSQTLVLGGGHDKDIRSVAVALAPEVDRILTTMGPNPKARPPEGIAAALKAANAPATRGGEHGTIDSDVVEVTYRGRTVKGPVFAVLLLVAVTLTGTMGYVLIEGWPIWDAFYMTVTTVAPVGFRAVPPLAGAGPVFTVILIFSGVGTAFYSATLLATIIVEGGLHRRFEQRRINRMLHDIRDHFILCGFGRIGSIVARELDEQGTPFVIIERSERHNRIAIVHASSATTRTPS